MMPTVADQQLVRLLELVEQRHAVDRSLLRLLDPDPEATLDEVARLTVGRRNQRLLRLRAGTFGPRLAAAAACRPPGNSGFRANHGDKPGAGLISCLYGLPKVSSSYPLFPRGGEG